MNLLPGTIPYNCTGSRYNYGKKREYKIDEMRVYVQYSGDLLPYYNDGDHLGGKICEMVLDPKCFVTQITFSFLNSLLENSYAIGNLFLISEWVPLKCVNLYKATLTK